MSHEVLEGSIQAVIYGNEETGWAVLRVAGVDGSLQTAVGYVPFPAPGEYILAEGRWVNNAEYGTQFSVQSLERHLPQDEPAILEYLASGILPGVGRVTARAMVEAFGTETLGIIESEPERLCRIKGINERRAADISRHYLHQSSLRRLMELLAAHELLPALASQIFQDYGNASLKALRDDPYFLLREPYAQPFAPVDRLAETMDIAVDDERRCRAGLVHELEYNLSQGHTFLPKDKLLPATEQLLGVTTDRLLPVYDALVAEGELREQPEGCCYLRGLFDAEERICACVAARASADTAAPRDLAELVGSIERELDISYAPAQREAIELAARQHMLILTGGPGTGKTTTVKGMLRLFDYMGLKVLLAAPTGRAAKRLSELTGRDAATIHRMLEFGRDPVSGALRFMRDENRPLKADVIVLDEVSMVDVPLMDSVMRALKATARLVLVGDPDQLPAVGPGTVLEDLLGSGVVPSVCLEEIFRQAALSRIVTSAHEINHGQPPALKNTKDADFFFLRRDGMMEAVDTLKELCVNRLPKGLGVDPSQIQVLTPTRRGPCGTESLNKVLQEALNPPAPQKLEVKYGAHVFREGDRIMQIRNDYDLIWRQADSPATGMGVFNGEIGTVVEIDPKASILTARFDDRLVSYPFDSLPELEPAYAMTVHKAQGSEYDAVVLAVTPGPQPLMTRRVLYTAVTRARKWLILVGQESVVHAMVSNDRRGRRYSGLCARLTAR